MVAATSPSGSGPPPTGPGGRLPRFDGAERFLHWATAALFLVLLATAAALYLAPLSAAVGRRPLVRDAHVAAGILLPVPWLVARGVMGNAALRADVRRLARWDAGDGRWLRSLGRDPFVRLGKFHPLQKLNAAFTAGAIGVMLATGVVMRWFEPFPLAWRTGATFVHDWLALAVAVVVALHVGKAMSDRQALSGMVRGSVSARWARRRHPRWHDEEVGGRG
ncbi:MAG TPA: cytochrome b/b6 domain-containing protein [Acidimicrobiales bacterium]|jgi:formate dehydrogenase subunit gamma|nr:cytochrome b/b6 domain-containing protein [Acidimicrobiales bacterium]